MYSSPNIIRTKKLRQVRWAGHEAHIKEREVQTEIWWESQKEGDN
jgi:hypothetical protein